MCRYLLFLSFNLLALGSFAQSYCFLNEGLKVQTKISFTLQNNRIIQGRWESWDYSADSSEVFPFEGVKVGLKLKVVFPEKVVPYQIPGPGHENGWTLYPKKLLIPAIQRNYETNKYGMIPIELESCPVEDKK